MNKDKLTVGRMYDRINDFSDGVYSKKFKCVESDDSRWKDKVLDYSCGNLIDRDNEIVGINIQDLPINSKWVQLK